MKKISKNEKGFTLVLSLVRLLVMSLMGGSLIVISSGDHQSNNTSDEYQQAFYVAETALLEGEKQLINSYMGPWVDVDKISVAKPAAGASDEENKKYEDWVTLQNKLNPSEVNTLQPDGESLTESHARNIDGRAILYADQKTKSILLAIEETSRRRIKQISFNKKNGIVPKSTTRKIEETINQNDGKKSSNDDRQESLDFLKKKMLEYAENLNFEKAAEIRDKIKIKERKELGIKQNI